MTTESVLADPAGFRFGPTRLPECGCVPTSLTLFDVPLSEIDMTANEFRQLLAKQTDANLLGPCLRDAIIPYVFAPNPPSWDGFREELVAQLGVYRTEITVVGSARFGFSLKPWNNLRKFTDRSDIDVVIVNASLFDRLWLGLLSVAYPRYPATETLGGWLSSRRKEVYTGWLTPLEIKLDPTIYGSKAKPILEFATLWFNTFKRVSRHLPRRHEDVKGRLYRTWEHVELYHLNSLAALRQTL